MRCARTLQSISWFVVLLSLAGGPAVRVALAGANTWYVNDDGDAMNGCTSWTDACPHLQTALALATAGDQIWVAGGTYKPDQGGGQTPGDREATFQLINGVGIYGGFSGVETSLEDRAGLFEQTILTGDLAGDDTPVACMENSPDCDAHGGLCADDGFCIIRSSNGENSYHVVTGSDTDATAILDGVTITGGNADGATPFDRGAGMYNSSGVPTVTNCMFSANAALLGGGMYNQTNSSPAVTDCMFKGNLANSSGGGMYNVVASSPIVSHCTFKANSANSFGGAMFNNASSSPAVVNCTFSNNLINGSGGGMYNQTDSNPTVMDCSFNENIAIVGSGGGMYNFSCSPLVTDCTFNRNSSGFEGAGGASGGGMTNIQSSPTVTHCTFNGNSANSFGGGMGNGISSDPAVSNCMFSGNSAVFGGGMSNFESSPVVSNCTFRGNSASNVGGGMHNSSSSPILANLILWENVDDSDGNSGGPFIDESAQIHTESGTPVVNYSIVQGGWSGAGGIGNINADPLFVDADGGDNVPGTLDDNLRLLAGSPAVDSARNEDVPEGIVADLDGEPRFIDDPTTPDCPQPGADCGSPPIVDMGAYEFGADCNGNGLPDECDVDCGEPGGPCDMPGCGTAADCNINGVPDTCDVEDGSHDCNDDSVPDECQTEGNDCDFNGIPDECQSDCDNDEVPDACEISGGAADCDLNGIPDACEIGGDPDCNINGTLDVCDILSGLSDDCNLNGIPDECEDPEALALVCVDFVGQCREKNLDAWSCTENWEELPEGVPFPDNSDFNFSVTLPPGFAVELDVSVSIDTLRILSEATLNIPMSGSDLTLLQPGGMFVEGAVVQGDDRSVMMINSVQKIQPGGSYIIQDSDETVRAALLVDIMTLVGLGSSNLPGGSMTVQGSADAVIDGDLRLTFDDKGSGTPPDFNTSGNTQIAVGGDFIIEEGAAISYDSANPLTLSGHFINQAIADYADIFDWFSSGVGGVEMTGPGGAGLQTIEAAGEDRGPLPVGLINNFAFGILRLSPNTVVQIVDTFDNQQDGVVACDEVLYVDTLEIAAGATLMTNGCRVYYNELIIDGGSVAGLNMNVIPIGADFDGNGDVDILDLLGLIAAWGSCVECTSCLHDLNGDCNVGIVDLLGVIAQWS